MKINRNNIDKVYNPVSPESNLNSISNANGKKQKGVVGGARDKIVLSEKAKKFSPVKSLTQTVIKEVSKQTSSKRLLQLKSDIAAGRYKVSSEDIAEAILGNIKKEQ